MNRVEIPIMVGDEVMINIPVFTANYTSETLRTHFPYELNIRRRVISVRGPGSIICLDDVYIDGKDSYNYWAFNPSELILVKLAKDTV